ncbi:MAG: exosortase system-associated protein, TIGR04073 family [Candidatus Omnitrophota bacterium]
MRNYSLFIFGLVALLIFASSALAVPERVKESGEKLVEGVEDVATGWAEVPEGIKETTEESNLIEGVTVGAVKGTGEAIIKTGEGVLDAATFCIPDEE